jgi:hypothetical protein
MHDDYAVEQATAAPGERRQLAADQPWDELLNLVAQVGIDRAVAVLRAVADA